METSLSTWKHKYQFGNFTHNLVLSDLCWKQKFAFKWRIRFVNELLCFQIRSNVSKLKAIFPSLKIYFQGHSNVSKFIVKFLSWKLCFYINDFQVGLCFQFVTRVSKLILFRSHVSKMNITVGVYLRLGFPYGFSILPVCQQSTRRLRLIN